MVLKPEPPVMAAATRKHEIHPDQFFRWRKLMQEGALSAVKVDEEAVRITREKKPISCITRLKDDEIP